MKKILFSYLKFWSSGYLKRVNPEIIAITGSVGKTSAKEAIFEVLKIKFATQVRKSSGNLNTELGVPLAILNYKNSPSNFFAWFLVLISVPFKSFFLGATKILVLELAADKPGDIEYFTNFIKPKVAVLTAIGPSHLDAFGSIESIIEEKSNLLRALENDGWAVLNIDDENVRKVSYGGRYLKKTYGIDNPADITAENITTKINETKALTCFEIKVSSEDVKVSQATLGLKSNVLASLAGAAVGKIYEISNEDIAEGLSKVVNEKHRMNVLKGINETIIIDDSYNANPLSMRAALDLLKHLVGKRKIAAIGDMREIGKISDEAHEIIGKYAHEVADLVVAVGTEAKKYQSQFYFKTTDQASEFLLKSLRPGDIILIKASRSIGLDKIAEKLKG